MNTKKILICEDNGVQAMLISRVVEEIGHTTAKIVDRGQQAIQKTREFNPDLIIMDIFLNGDMTGIEAMKIIRKTSNKPVIYVSGNSDPFYTHQAKQTRCTDFLYKPLKVDALREAIHQALGDRVLPTETHKSFFKSNIWPFNLF